MITEPFLTGQRFAARLPEDTDPAEFARDRLYSTARVFRAEVTVHLADALVRELLPGVGAWRGGWPTDLAARNGAVAGQPTARTGVATH